MHVKKKSSSLLKYALFAFVGVFGFCFISTLLVGIFAPERSTDREVARLERELEELKSQKPDRNKLNSQTTERGKKVLAKADDVNARAQALIGKQEPAGLGMGKVFSVDELQYAVLAAEYSNQISPKFKRDVIKPDSVYLLVTVSVKNAGKQAYFIPNPKLVDENGAEYEMSADSIYTSKPMVFDRLNPGVIKQGIVAFDVPRGHRYKVELSGPGLFAGSKEVQLP